MIGETVARAQRSSEALRPYHIMIVAIVALSVIFDGFDTYTLGLSVPAIAREWGRPASAFGTTTALSTVATVVGAMSAGIVSDRIGRKYTLMLATLLSGGGTLLSAAASTMAILTVSRVVTGIGLGGAMVTAVVLVSEHMPTRHRAAAIVLMTLGIPLGHTLSGAVASLVLEPWGWRSLFLIGAVVPCIVFVVQALAMPETPAFMRGRAAYRQKLEHYHRRLGTQELDVPVDGLAALDGGTGIGALFQKKIVRETLLLWVGVTASVFITHVASQWLPSLIVHAGGSLKSASQSIVYFGIGQIGGALFATPLIFLFGSRWPMLGGAIVTFILALVLMARFDAAPTAVATFITFAVMAWVGSQMVALHHALGPAIYPEAVRGRGTGFALAIGKSGAVISSYSGAWAINHGGMAYFGLIATAAVVQFCCFSLIRRHAPAGMRPSAGH